MGFSEEELMVREMARNFVDEEVMPIIEHHHREGSFPKELAKKMADLGMFGSNLPEKYGCAELNNVAYGLIMQELERGDSGVRSFASVQGSLVMYPIFKYGSEEQKDYWLPLLASGEKIGCFGLTEPDHGSDPGGMVTKAVEKGSDYVINGAKMWITNGTVADMAIVWAKLDGEVRGFIVEKGMEGFTAPEMKGKFSLRASVTSELVFDNVVIPKTNLLPKAKGLAGPLGCLTQARYGIAWVLWGAAEHCYSTALDYTLSRTQFGKPIAGFQTTQQKLAHIITELTKAQLLAMQLGKLKDNDMMDFSHVSMAKRNNVAYGTGNSQKLPANAWSKWHH